MKKLVELHGGRVEAYSEGSERGSRFVVHLPLHSGEASHTPTNNPALEQSPVRRTILVVDDNEDAATTVVTLLGMMGHAAEAVFDGNHALAAIRRIQPDLALIDLGLPGLDGYEVARRARASGDADGVKLVAYSGYAQPEDLRRSRDAGFDAHVAKPVDAHALASMIAALCAK